MREFLALVLLAAGIYWIVVMPKPHCDQVRRITIAHSWLQGGCP